VGALALDPQTSDPQTSDPQTSDPQTSDPQTSDPQILDPQTLYSPGFGPPSRQSCFIRSDRNGRLTCADCTAES
jgi:hypothetical protein